MPPACRTRPARFASPSIFRSRSSRCRTRGTEDNRAALTERGDRETPASGLPAPTACGERTTSARRHRLLAAIIVEAALRLAAEPAGLDVFHQQRTGAVFRVREPFVQHLHDRDAGVEPDETSELERTPRVVGADAHRGFKHLERAHALRERFKRRAYHLPHEA